MKRNIKLYFPHCTLCHLDQDIHERHFHVGREHTLALVSQQFWILGGKSFVRRNIDELFFARK